MTNQPLSPEQPLQALALQAPTGYWRGSSSGPATESQKTRHLPLPQHPLSHIQTHTHALPHTLTCAHPLTHTCTHTNAHFGTGTHIDTHTHTHTHTHRDTGEGAQVSSLCSLYRFVQSLCRSQDSKQGESDVRDGFNQGSMRGGSIHRTSNSTSPALQLLASIR